MQFFSSGADAVACHVSVQRLMGGARDGQHVQAGLCRAAHHRPHPHDVRPNRKPIYNSAKRHSNTVNNTNAKRGRPRGRGLATLQIPFPAHRSSSATNPDARSPSRRWHAGRATSMRPTESVGSRRRTRMRTGKSGARAPDRNRGRPPRMPPPPGTTYEDQLVTQTSRQQTKKPTPAP